MRKRVLSFILVLCLLLTSLPVYGDVSTDSVDTDLVPGTDGSESSTKWFQMFDTLLPNKAINGLKFYLVLDSLRNDDYSTLTTQVNTVYNSNAARAAILDNYDIDAAKVLNIMKFYLDTYPANMAEVEADTADYGRNIYSDIYHDETLVYSEYMVRFYEYLNEQFWNLTPAMQGPISTWDVSGQGQIHLYQNILNIIIKDYIFLVETNRVTGAVKKDMFLRPYIRTVVITELTRAATAGGAILSATEVEDINDYADMFMALGNVILESAELNLTKSSQIDNAITLGRFVDLVLDRTVGEFSPSILINPDLATVYYQPNEDEFETDYMQYTAFVQESTSPVVWTISDPTVASVDSTGFVTLNPDFKPTIAFDETLTVTATLRDNPTISDTASVQVLYTPLGAVDFIGPYISGYEDNAFRGLNAVSREEIATMLVRVLGFDVKEYVTDEEGEFVLDPIGRKTPIYYTKADFPTPSFNDVNSSDWSYIYVELAKVQGWFEADADGNLRKFEAIARGEIPVIMMKAWAALNITVDALGKHFIADVPSTHKNFDAIQAFYNQGIVSGYKDDTFRPDNNTTRFEVVIMINKIIERSPNELGQEKFEDLKFGHWAYGNVIAATENQVIQNDLPTE